MNRNPQTTNAQLFELAWILEDLHRQVDRESWFSVVRTVDSWKISRHDDLFAARDFVEAQAAYGAIIRVPALSSGERFDAAKHAVEIVAFIEKERRRLGYKYDLDVNPPRRPTKAPSVPTGHYVACACAHPDCTLPHPDYRCGEPTQPGDICAKCRAAVVARVRATPPSSKRRRAKARWRKTQAKKWHLRYCGTWEINARKVAGSKHDWNVTVWDDGSRDGQDYVITTDLKDPDSSIGAVVDDVVEKAIKRLAKDTGDEEGLERNEWGRPQLSDRPPDEDDDGD